MKNYLLVELAKMAVRFWHDMQMDAFTCVPK